MKKTQRIVLWRYDPKGPWHLVREDNHTVCGKAEASALDSEAAYIAPGAPGGIRGTIRAIDRVCANCERMRGADTIRLNRPGAGS